MTVWLWDEETGGGKLCLGWNSNSAADSRMVCWSQCSRNQKFSTCWLLLAEGAAVHTYLGIICYLQMSLHSGMKKMMVPARKSPKLVFGVAVSAGLCALTLRFRFALCLPISMEATFYTRQSYGRAIKKLNLLKHATRCLAEKLEMQKRFLFF